MNPLSGSDNSDFLLYSIRILTFGVVALFWLGSLTVTSVQLARKNTLPRALFYFLSVTVFLAVNVVTHYYLNHWHRSHPRQHYFEKSHDIYILLWLPLNVVLMLGMGELAYQLKARLRREIPGPDSDN